MSKRNSATSIYLGRRAAFPTTLVSSSLRLNRLRAKHASLDFPTTKRKRIYVSGFDSLYVKSRSVLRQSSFPGDSLLSKVWCQDFGSGFGAHGGVNTVSQGFSPEEVIFTLSAGTHQDDLEHHSEIVSLTKVFPGCLLPQCIRKQTVRVIAEPHRTRPWKS